MNLNKCSFYCLFGLICSLFITSCGGSETTSKYIPDVSKIQASSQLIRFDKDLMAIDSTNVEAGLAELQEKHPAFAPFYLKNILPNFERLNLSQATKRYLTDEYSQILHDSVAYFFSDNTELKQIFTDMSKYYAYYFSDKQNPFERVYTYTSAYQFGCFTNPDNKEAYVAVGLDYALGENHKAYSYTENLRHQYIRQRLTKDNLPVLAAEVVVTDIMDAEVKLGGNYFIDHMIYNGKKYFLIDLLMPKIDDHLKFGFTKDQMAYCIPKEASLYENLSKSIDLYSDDVIKFRQYVNPGPFDPEKDRHSNAGSWLGMKMVQSYYRKIRNEIKHEMSGKTKQDIDRAALRKTLEEVQAQAFLKKYKPKRG